MSIEVSKAIEILSEVLAGDKPSRFFQQKRIALDGLQMEPTHFNHKLKGRQKFTKADFMRLAHYFELGETGYNLFEEENEEAFRSGLQTLGIGAYTKDPTQKLTQILASIAGKNDATLEVIDLFSSRNNRSGLVSGENAGQPTGLTLRMDDRLRLRFHFPRNDEESLWFIAFNIHHSSSSVRILNPVFKENRIKLASDQLNYPENGYLEIRDVTLLGSHRFVALAATSTYLSTILNETSRLLTIYNGTDEVVTDNKFDGLLDKVATQNIEHGIQAGAVYCAQLDYRQIHGA